MGKVARFEDLEVWQMARILAQDVFQTFSSSKEFLKDFNLKNQINASTGSIMDNIAEGFERNSKNEFINFLTYAKGSCGEVKSQLYRAQDRNYIEKEVFEDLYNKAELIGRKLGAFIKYLNSSAVKGYKFKGR